MDIQLLSRWAKSDKPEYYVTENQKAKKLHRGPKVQLLEGVEDSVLTWAIARRKEKLKVNPRLMSKIAKQRFPALRGKSLVH